MGLRSVEPWRDAAPSLHDGCQHQPRGSDHETRAIGRPFMVRYKGLPPWRGGSARPGCLARAPRRCDTCGNTAVLPTKQEGWRWRTTSSAPGRFVGRDGSASRQARLRIVEVAELEIAVGESGRCRSFAYRAVRDAVRTAFARAQRTGRFTVDEWFDFGEVGLAYSALHTVHVFVAAAPSGSFLHT